MNHRNSGDCCGSVQRLERRTGTSLVEMVVVITLSSILLGVVATMIYNLQRWDQGLRDRAVGRDQMARLAEVLRKDLRRAEDVSLTKDGVLEVRFPAGAVTRYEILPEGCRRESRSAAEARSAFDLFAVGNSKPIRVDRSDDARTMILVTLPLVDASDRPVSRPPLEIRAILGANLPHTFGS